MWWQTVARLFPVTRFPVVAPCPTYKNTQMKVRQLVNTQCSAEPPCCALQLGLLLSAFYFLLTVAGLWPTSHDQGHWADYMLQFRHRHCPTQPPTQIHTCMHTHIHTHAHIPVHPYIDMHTHTHMHRYTHTHTYTRTDTCTHTHTDTHKQTNNRH